MPLQHASKDEINAAYNVVHRELLEVVQQFAPPFFQGTIRQKLEEPETIRRVVKMIDDAIDAAAAVRERQQQK